MKVIIAGSRTIRDYREVTKAIEQSGFEITEVVSGGAMGVDLLGERWARRNGIPVKCFVADWYEYGKSAGPIRNTEMALYADALILVWDGESRGSANMKMNAETVGIKIYEHVL